MIPRRFRRRVEEGLLLPLLAFALVGGGALWLAAMHAGPADPAHVDGRGARTPLLAARRALIAHAAAYPESYGPLGAGPGHLVCPDTDTPVDGRASGGTRGGERFGGDGPNPPCGNGALAVGRLPRHVSLGGRRRAFHHEPVQRFVYAVASGYVNNPPGGAVRRSPDATSSRHDVVAIVLDPGGVALGSGTLDDARDPRELLGRVRETIRREAGARPARSVPHVLVTRGDLLAAAERRVAAWFVETATVAARRRGAAQGPANSAIERTRWPEADCPEGGASDVSRWVGDDDATCGNPVATIENTPRARHWFVREHWWRDLSVKRHPRCRGVYFAPCRLGVVRDGDTMSIVIELVPANPPSTSGSSRARGAGR